MKCEESEEEPENKSKEKFYQLSCFIEKGRVHTVKPLLQAQASVRIITVHGDGGGPLLEATNERKVCSFNLMVWVAILIC